MSPLPLEDIETDTTGTCLHSDSQDSGTGLLPGRHRPQRDAQRVALLGEQMQTTQTGRTDRVDPAENGCTGVMSQNLFGGP